MNLRHWERLQQKHFDHPPFEVTPTRKLHIVQKLWTEFEKEIFMQKLFNLNQSFLSPMQASNTTSVILNIFTEFHFYPLTISIDFGFLFDGRSIETVSISYWWLNDRIFLP